MGLNHNPSTVMSGLIDCLDAANPNSCTIPTPANGYWSNYLGGSTDTLTAPFSSANFDFGTGDFTVEAWIYQTVAFVAETYRLIWQNYSGANNSRIAVGFNGDKFGIFFNSTGIETTINSGFFTPNTWIHVAVSRQSSTVRIFVNGVLRQTGSTGVDFNAGNACIVGANWLGYLSNLRVVKGTAVYTAGFTVPTVPLTAVAGTTLLTCQSSTFIDNSINNLTITPTGIPAVSPFVPFVTVAPVLWSDVSGQRNNATLVNNVSYSLNNSGILNFNGSNQYALVGPVTNNLTTTMSFSIWFRTNSLAATQTLWWDDNALSGGDSWISIETTGKIQSNRASDGYGVLQSVATIATGTWYNFVFVANGSAGKLFYINGALDTSDSVPINSRQGRSYVTIGVNTPTPPTPTTGYFNGSIGMFTIYSVALTADQVAQNFNALRGRYGI